MKRRGLHYEELAEDDGTIHNTKEKSSQLGSYNFPNPTMSRSAKMMMMIPHGRKSKHNPKSNTIYKFPSQIQFPFHARLLHPNSHCIQYRTNPNEMFPPNNVHEISCDHDAERITASRSTVPRTVPKCRDETRLPRLQRESRIVVGKQATINPKSTDGWPTMARICPPTTKSKPSVMDPILEYKAHKANPH